MSKNHTPLCLLPSFCTTEYLVSITINRMREQLIILHLLIYLFYLLQLNIVSLISPTILLALCLLLVFCKMEFCFYLEKKLVRSKTRAARPIPLALIDFSHHSFLLINITALILHFPCLLTYTYLGILNTCTFIQYTSCTYI